MATVRTQREIRQKAPLWLIGLLFANLIIMAFDAKDSNGKQKVVRIWTQTLASPIQTARENEELRKQLAAVQDQLRIANQKAAENDRLKSLLNLKEQAQYQMVPARVIARDPSVWCHPQFSPYL